MRILIVSLCLVISTSAIAVPVDPDAPDGVAARVYEGEMLWILCSDGLTYFTDSHDGDLWHHHGESIPVPLEEIADWGVFFLVTTDGSIWRSPLGYNTTWSLIESFPCPTGQVGSEQESSGDIKSMFR